MSVPHEVPKRTSEVPTRCPKPVSTPREQTCGCCDRRTRYEDLRCHSGSQKPTRDRTAGSRHNAPRLSTKLQISCTTNVLVLYTLTMVKISVSKARERLSEIVEMSQTEPVELQHYGKRAAILVSPQQYDEMREAFEESEDLAAFDAALVEEGGNIPWEQVKADLGWS